MKKFLTSFSYIFHPILIPVFGTCYFLFGTDAYYEPLQKYLIVIQVTIVLVFIPLCVFYLLRTIGKADSIMLAQVSQRRTPLLVQSMATLILMRNSAGVNGISELYYFFFGGFITAIVLFGLAWIPHKSSIHMAAISGLTAYLIALSLHNQINALPLISIMILACGLVAASRIEMSAHNYRELFTGILVGALPQIVLWPFWL